VTRQACVGRSDASQYAETSGDSNPLHLSRDFTAQTPFGYRVAHGALVLSMLVDEVFSAASHIVGLKATFKSPIFVGEPFAFTSEAVSETETHLKVSDGGLELAETWVHCQNDLASTNQTEPSEIQSRHTEVLGSDLWEPLGSYVFDVGKNQLLPTHGVIHSALAVVSMIAGSVCPGEGAVLKGLKIRRYGLAASNQSYSLFLKRPTARAVARGAYRCEVLMFGKDFTSEFLLLEFSAFQVQLPDNRTISPAAEANSTPVVTVTGASRGLGRAIVNEFGYRESSCISLQRSAEASKHSLTCDLRNYAEVQEAAAFVKETYGRQKYLFMNATASLRLHSIDRAHQIRIQEYINREVHIFLNTLTVMTKTLDENEATLIMSSSAFLDDESPWQAPAKVAHYLAAKSAVEKLFSGFSEERKNWAFLLIRLPPFNSSLAFSNGLDGKFSAEDMGRVCVEAAIRKRHRPGLQIVTGQECLTQLIKSRRLNVTEVEA